MEFLSPAEGLLEGAQAVLAERRGDPTTIEDRVLKEWLE